MKHKSIYQLTFALAGLLALILSACGSSTQPLPPAITPTSDPPTLVPTQAKSTGTTQVAVEETPTASPTSTPETYVGDGWIALTSNINWKYGLYLMKPEGGEPIKIISDFKVITGIDWSPDGSQLVFSAISDYISDLYLINVDGSNLRKITDSSRHSSGAKWSSNGRYLAYWSWPWDEDILIPSTLFIYDIFNGNSYYLCDAFSFDWSPNGQRLVIERPDSRIQIINVDDRQIYDLISPGKLPRWASNGDEIAYVSYSQDIYNNIFLIKPDGSNVEQITNSDSYAYIGALSWSPDGCKLAYLAIDDTIAGNSPYSANLFIVDEKTRNVNLITGNTYIPMEGYASPPVWSPNGKKITFRQKVSDYDFKYLLNVVDLENGTQSLLVEADVYSLDWTANIPSPPPIQTPLPLLSISTWPMHRYNAQRSGASTTKGPEVPIVKWVFQTSGHFSSPVIGANRTVFIDSTDGFLYAIDFEGNQKWNYEIVGEWPAKLAIAKDDTLLVGKGNILQAFLPNGELLWTYPIGEKIGDLVILPDGTILIGSQCIHALDSMGVPKWGAEMGMCSETGYEELAVSNDGNIYGLSGFEVHAFNSDGELQWEEWTAPGVRGYNTAITIDALGLVYVNGEAALGAGVAFPIGSLEVYNPWGYYRNSYDQYIASPPAIAPSGKMYIGWSEVGKNYQTEDERLSSDLGPFQLMEINRDHQITWSFVIGDAFCSYPVVGGDGTIYIISCEGDLFAIKPSGNLKWKINIGESLEAGNWWIWDIAIGTDTVYISTENNLYAIGE